MSLSFNPTGFTYKRSLSNASPNFNGVETFYWDPTIHGFSGDLLCSAIIYRSATFEVGATVATRSDFIIKPANYTYGKTVYPMPITVNDVLQTPAQNIPAENMAQGAIPLGVAQKFRYTPLGTDQEVTVLNFPQNTPLQPNTLVYVDVITDPMAVYEAQTNSPFGYGPGYGANTFMQVNGINTYTVPLLSRGPVATPEVTVNITFVLGEFTGPTAGSRQYIFSDDATNATNSLTSINQWLGDFGDGVYSLGLTEGIIDNEFSYQGGTIYPYVIQDVKVTNTATTNGYASTGNYPGSFPTFPTT